MTATLEKPTARDTRRLAIVGIARDVFMAEGYASASMSAIAARLGGSKGTLYNYFKSKEDLFVAVMLEDCEREADAAIDSLVQDPDIAHGLLNSGEQILRFLMSESALTLHRLIAAEATRFPELGRAFYDAGPRANLARVADYLAKAMAEGRLRRADPVVAAEHLSGLLKGELYRRRLWNVPPAPTEAEITAHVASGVAVFMAAYGPA